MILIYNEAEIDGLYTHKVKFLSDHSLLLQVIAQTVITN